MSQPNRLDRMWERFIRHPKLASLALGLLVALGYPPVHGWWIAIPALAAFVALLHRAPNWRAAAWCGWLFGWAHLTLANNWIATAFTHQAKMPEFLGWLAVPLLCVYLAVYPALAAGIAYALARPPDGREAILHEVAEAVKLRRIAPAGASLAVFGALFAGVWIITEWARSWVFTGYPWPPLGLILLGGWDTPGLARVVPWFGTYALSGFMIILALGIASGLAHRQTLQTGLLVSAIALFMIMPRYAGPQDTDRTYRLVQPLIPQDEINDGPKFEEQFQRIASLTAPGRESTRLVLWPESAVPDYLEDGYPSRYYARMTAGADPDFARRRIAGLIGPKSTLLTGVVNLDFAVVEGFRRPVSARNSVIAMDGDPDAGAAIQHSYDKAHLVPYGEYLPLVWLLEPLGLSRLTAGTVPYLPGPGPRTLDLGDHGKAGVQICYEIVFSGQVVDRDDRPDFLFNPSNDGWFGSWGPPQHLGQARLRAIEEGLPVLRSTTTGISAVIDARGVVRATIPMGKSDAIDGFIPKAAPPTVFARFGNAVPLAWAAFLLVLALGVPRLLALRSARG